MKIGKLSWVSPKGYGFVTLEEGGGAFVPAHVIQELNEKDSIEGRQVRVGLSQGNIGKMVIRMSLDADPLFLSSNL